MHCALNGCSRMAELQRVYRATQRYAGSGCFITTARTLLCVSYCFVQGCCLQSVCVSDTNSLADVCFVACCTVCGQMVPCRAITGVQPVMAVAPITAFFLFQGLYLWSCARYASAMSFCVFYRVRRDMGANTALSHCYPHPGVLLGSSATSGCCTYRLFF
jgi:hypothetical protein